MTNLPSRRHLTTLSILLLGSLIAAQSTNPLASGGEENPLSAGPQRSAGQLRMRKRSVRDPGARNVVAVSMLAPSTWRFEGRVVWNLNYSNLANGLIRVTSPDGLTTFQTLPLTPFVWTRGGVAFIPIGRLWLGNEVRPTISAPTEFVRRIVLPRYRSGVRARVVRTTELPEVAAVVRQSMNGARVRAAKIRIEYTENGRPMEEDIYVALQATVNPYMKDTTSWGAQSLFSMRSVKGRLDSFRDLPLIMATSARVTPEWFGQYREVARIWTQTQRNGIRAAAKISRMITKTGEEIRQIYREAYENHSRAQDRMSDQYSRYIRGVERYDDPVGGGSVSLPSGYDNAWVSDTGEYVLSEQVGFDPNVGSLQTWRRMGVTPLGR